MKSIFFLPLCPRYEPFSDVAHFSASVHAHMRHACPPDLSHTHPRNYGERTGWCQRGETGGCVFGFPLPARLLQVADYTDVDSWPALEKTPLIQYSLYMLFFLADSVPAPGIKYYFLVPR